MCSRIGVSAFEICADAPASAGPESASNPVTRISDFFYSCFRFEIFEPSAAPRSGGCRASEPCVARFTRDFALGLRARSAWAALHAARRRQSLLWLRVAVGAHEQGNTQRVKAEQHTEGRKGVRAQRTGQRSGAGWMQTRAMDALVVMVLRSTWMCRWLCEDEGRRR